MKTVTMLGLFALGLALLLSPVPAQSQLASKGHVVSKGTAKARTSILPCPEDTFNDILALPSCWQKTAVLHWLTWHCSDDGSSGLCAGLSGAGNGANFKWALDHGGCLPLGACPMTYFMGRGSLPNYPGLTGSQSLDITITGTVYGSGHFNPWPHYKQVNNNTSYVGYTGAGQVEWKFTINCNPGGGTGGCISAPSGGTGGAPAVSDLVCNATTVIGTPQVCNEQTTEAPYAAWDIVTTPAPASAPYSFTCELIMAANGGSAYTVSNGLHFAP